jgi:hypothetical protein
MRKGEAAKGRAFLAKAARAQPGNPRYLLAWLLSLLGRPAYRAAHGLMK